MIELKNRILIMAKAGADMYAEVKDGIMKNYINETDPGLIYGDKLCYKKRCDVNKTRKIKKLTAEIDKNIKFKNIPKSKNEKYYCINKSKID